VYDLPYEISCDSITLKHAVIPFTYYIIDGTNNSITTQLGTGTIIPGNYSYTELATALQLLLISLGHTGATVSYSISTDKFSITSVDSPQFEMEMSYDMSVILGFSSVTQTGADTYISDIATGLNSHRRDLYIDITEVHGNFFVNDQHNSNFKLRNDVNFMENIQFNEFFDYRQRTFNIQNLNRRIGVKLRHTDGSIVDLRNSNWSFIISFE
jgi:hypothetical protein